MISEEETNFKKRKNGNHEKIMSDNILVGLPKPVNKVQKIIFNSQKRTSPLKK